MTFLFILNIASISLVVLLALGWPFYNLIELTFKKKNNYNNKVTKSSHIVRFNCLNTCILISVIKCNYVSKTKYFYTYTLVLFLGLKFIVLIHFIIILLKRNLP